MMRLRVLLSLASSAVLAACATTEPALRGTQEGWNTEPWNGRSAYGQFLAGQAALEDGRSDQAAAYFQAARNLGEDPGLLGERAFTASLLAGEVTRAAELAPRAEGGTEGVRRLGMLTVAVDALARGKGKDAQALLADPALGFPHRPAVALLTPWAAQAAGDAAAAQVLPELRNDRLVQYFGQLGRAEIFERAGKPAEAEADYKALMEVAAVRPMFALDYGAFLERRKRRDEAVALYDSILAEAPNDVALLDARARAVARKSPPALVTGRQGAANTLVACAAVFTSERQSQFALAYLRLALHLDPKREDALLMVGDLLDQGGDIDGARAAYAKIPTGSARYAAAQGKIAWTLQNAGDKDKAIAVAEAAAKAPEAGRSAQLVYADLLRANDRWADAVAVIDPLVEAEKDKPDWRLLYMRGVSLERAGRWPDAERDLEKALELNPNEPELLNYLGYSWIDRNERLPEALSMVQKAVKANPQSGAMLDSLGWAYHRLGDDKAAVEMLEQAIEIEPGDPDINDHLGDVYWRLGRKTEAQFQWRRVLSLEPTDEQKAAAEAKLKDGLGSKGPAKAPAVANGANAL
ncbi:hypothetical protein DDF65_19335 [Caulobacter radicis]|uniref:Tetratricopeptide repeat protein n=2 Tax=Caulobacter radicis TaxID=2172650 RepID=A0A2T9J2S0_9CAUL|nr:tetratricopeptide repeat protein [Caulobacter radicis]PVM74517.1 hypothetical protein DDF65_19335 [Caulobacter radicis]